MWRASVSDPSGTRSATESSLMETEVDDLAISTNSRAGSGIYGVERRRKSGSMEATRRSWRGDSKRVKSGGIIKVSIAYLSPQRPCDPCPWHLTGHVRSAFLRRSRSCTYSLSTKCSGLESCLVNPYSDLVWNCRRGITFLVHSPSVALRSQTCLL